MNLLTIFILRLYIITGLHCGVVVVALPRSEKALVQIPA